MLEFFTRSNVPAKCAKKERSLKAFWNNTKKLAGLSGCQNATSAINFLDEQHEMTPGSPLQRITGTSANAAFLFPELLRLESDHDT